MKRSTLLYASFSPLAWSICVVLLWGAVEGLERQGLWGLAGGLQGLMMLLFIPVALCWFWFLRIIGRSSSLSRTARFAWISGVFFVPILTMPLFAFLYPTDATPMQAGD